MTSNCPVVLRRVSKKFSLVPRHDFTALLHFKSLLGGKTRNIPDRRDFWALKNVDFEVKHNEVVGVIGKNGSGKTTLLRIIAGTLKQDAGDVDVRGRIVPLFGMNTGLSPRLTVKENVFLMSALLGLGRDYVKEKFDAIVTFAGLEDFISLCPYQLSSGMQQRLGFSIAVHSNPEILILDEVFSVGDIETQRKFADKMKELIRGNVTVVIASHNMKNIKDHCGRVIWLDDGTIRMEGGAAGVVEAYKEYYLNSDPAYLCARLSTGLQRRILRVFLHTRGRTHCFREAVDGAVQKQWTGLLRLNGLRQECRNDALKAIFSGGRNMHCSR